MRRYLWVADLIGITIGAALAGHATANFIAAALPLGPPPAVRHARVATAPLGAPDKSDVRVVLDAHGRRELLELLPQRPGAHRAPAAAPFDGVRQTGPHSYEVPRAIIDQFLGGGITPPWPRVVPLARAGEPVGFRLFGVAGNSPFAALGLASGDLLLQVNGRSLATPAAALEAFTALRAAGHVALSIERDGRLIRMDYAIRDAI